MADWQKFCEHPFEGNATLERIQSAVKAELDAGRDPAPVLGLAVIDLVTRIAELDARVLELSTRLNETKVRLIQAGTSGVEVE